MENITSDGMDLTTAARGSSRAVWLGLGALGAAYVVARSKARQAEREHPPAGKLTTSPLVGRMLWPAMVRAAFSPSSVPDSFRRFPVWMTLRPAQLRANAAEASLMVPAAARLQKRYDRLTMPLTIMAGEDDKVADAQDNSSRLHRQLAHSTLCLYPGKGPMLHHLVQDDIVAEAVKLREAAALQAPAAQGA